MCNHIWFSVKHIREARFVIESQEPYILDPVERSELHPVMLAYGLWKDEADLITLTDEIVVNRQTQPLRPSLEF